MGHAGSIGGGLVNRLRHTGVVYCNLIGLCLKLSSGPAGTSCLWTGWFFRGCFSISFFQGFFFSVRRARRGPCTFDRFSGYRCFIRFKIFNLLSEWGFWWNRRHFGTLYFCFGWYHLKYGKSYQVLDCNCWSGSGVGLFGSTVGRWFGIGH